MSDAEIIDDLGGPSKVATLLNFQHNGAQRVSNWKKRGIPAAIKVQFPNIFLKRRPSKDKEKANAA